VSGALVDPNRGRANQPGCEVLAARRGVALAQLRGVAGGGAVNAVLGSGGCDLSLATAPFVLSAAEYEALPFAAGMLDARADQFDADDLHALARLTRKQASVLRGVHDRWHLTRVRSEGLEASHVDCAWCANARAVA
jgi:hypothetical protein